MPFFGLSTTEPGAAAVSSKVVRGAVQQSEMRMGQP